MTAVTEKEGREMCEAMCGIVNAGLITIKECGRVFGRIAQLTVTTDEEILVWKKRIKQIE